MYEQIMCDTLLVLRGEIAETEGRIAHHKYVAQQLESRLTMLKGAAERLSTSVDYALAASRKAAADKAKD